MGVIIPDDYFQASFIFTVDGNTKEKVTSIGFRPVDPDAFTATEAADQIYDDATVSGNVGAADANIDTWVFQGVSVIKGTTLGPLVGQHIEPLRGTIASPGIPPNCSWLVKKSTGLGGRNNRGRMYWPPSPLNETNVDSAGNINGTLVGILQGRMDNLLDFMSAATFELFLFHSVAFAPTQITGFSVESQIATQRRRLR